EEQIPPVPRQEKPAMMLASAPELVSLGPGGKDIRRTRKRVPAARKISAVSGCYVVFRRVIVNRCLVAPAGSQVQPVPLFHLFDGFFVENENGVARQLGHVAPYSNRRRDRRPSHHPAVTHSRSPLQSDGAARPQ